MPCNGTEHTDARSESAELYFETCGELLGGRAAAVADAMQNVDAALAAEHSAQAWSDLAQAARELAEYAEALADEALAKQAHPGFQGRRAA